MIRWLLLVGLALPAGAQAHDPLYYGYGYDYPYYHAPRTDLELSRIRGELTQQRRRAAAESRERSAEFEVLRRQLYNRNQVSAAQACYYRTTGGLELCADLFEEQSPDRDRCETLVRERNPGC